MSTMPFRAPSPLVFLVAALSLQLAAVPGLHPVAKGPVSARPLMAQEPTGETPSAARSAGSPRSADRGPPWWARDLALLVGLLGYDRPLEDAVQELRAQRHPGWEDAASAAKTIGDWHRALPVFAAGTALVGGVTEGTDGLEKTAAILGGVLAGSMVNEAVNQLVGRRRPSEDVGAFAFDPLHGHASFPSGHAAFGFSMAGAVDAATEGWPLAAVAYTAAGATAASRLYHGKHWVSDVVVGAVIGTTVSRWSTRWAMERLGVAEEGGSAGSESTSGSPDFLDRLRPVATPTYIGFTVRF